MAADSEKEQDKEQGEEQKKKRDEKFLKFAREYQEKIGNIVETQENKPFNDELKTIRGIEKRIMLLLPERFWFDETEEIICFKDSPYGGWGEALEDFYEEDYNRIPDEKLLDKMEKNSLEKKKDVKEEWKNTLQKHCDRIKENKETPSTKAAFENRRIALEKRSKKIQEELYDMREKHPIFGTFTDTERNLYELLLDYIQFWNVESDDEHESGQKIKNKGWWIANRQKRDDIYKLFCEAVKENRQKWKLSDSDLDMVYRKMFCPKYNKTILEKDKLLKMETPNSWIEIIRRNSKVEVENAQEKGKEEEKEFIKNLKKLEKTLKKLGVTQQAVDDFQAEGYGFNQDKFAKWLEGMYKEEKK